MNDVLSEPRVRQAIQVLEDEKRRLAANLVMALTPSGQGPAPADIHEAVAAFRSGSDQLEAAREGLKGFIPFDTTI